MPDETSAELLARYSGGDDRAAEELFSRYVAKLTFLARTRLAPKIATRTDPEDIVLSAYRSFFVGARSGRFLLRRSGDLWRLLVSITMHKLYHHVRHHRAAARSVQTEQTLDINGGERFPTSREPSPEEAIAVADELQKCMAGLDAFSRRVLELRLQDESLSSIAADTGRSERTVRRMLATLEERLSKQLGVAADD